MDLMKQHQFSSEEEFDTLMNPIPVMIRACNKDGELCYSNTAWQLFTQNTNSWLTGVHPDFLPELENIFAAHADLKTTFKIKYKYQDNNGNYRWLAEQAVPWYSSEGVFLGFVCYTQDIDELINTPADSYNPNTKQLLNEQDLNEELAASNEELNFSNEELLFSQEKLGQANSNLEQILNMLPASVVVIRGHDLVVEMINDSNLSYWKKTKEQVVGKPFLEILPDLANQPFAGQLRRVMATGK